MTVGNSIACRMEEQVPGAYKLGIKPNGEPTLLGAFRWWEGDQGGVEWRPLETVRLNDDGSIRS